MHRNSQKNTNFMKVCFSWKTVDFMDKCLAIVEMGDRLATTDMGRKLRSVMSLLERGRWVPI